jgi:soluble lytic murein transglycosylase
MRILLAAALLASSALSTAAHADATGADDNNAAAAPASREGDGIPDQLDSDQKSGYRKVFAAIRAERWQDAQLQLDSMKPGPAPRDRPRRDLYRQEFAQGRSLAPILQLIGDAPELPQAEQLSRMARTRGATDTPALPDRTAAGVVRRRAGPPARPLDQERHRRHRDRARHPTLVKADQGVEAEGVVARFETDLTPEAKTEWQQKVAWIYYVAGDDDNARRVAAKAQDGVGDWAPQADWVAGLPPGATGLQRRRQPPSSESPPALRDTELRSAGLYWARAPRWHAAIRTRSRSSCAPPPNIARPSTGCSPRPLWASTRSRRAARSFVAEDWRALERRPNVRVAAALVEIGEDDLADEVLRYQAKLGTRDRACRAHAPGRAAQPAEHPALAGAQLPAGRAAAGRGALSRAQLDARGRLACRQGAGVCPHAAGIALQFGHPQRRARWA